MHCHIILVSALFVDMSSILTSSISKKYFLLSLVHFRPFGYAPGFIGHSCVQEQVWWQFPSLMPYIYLNCFLQYTLY